MESAAASLSLNDWAVLAVIAESDRHGFAVARELGSDGSIGKVWTVPRPLVYRAIEHLLVLDYIEPLRTEDGQHGPRRVVMRPTRTGRARLRKWLQTPVAHMRDVRSELLLKFMLLDRQGKPLAPLATLQLECFRPAFAGVAQLAADASGPDEWVGLWRLESSAAIERTLREVIRRDRKRK